MQRAYVCLFIYLEATIVAQEVAKAAYYFSLTSFSHSQNHSQKAGPPSPHLSFLFSHTRVGAGVSQLPFYKQEAGTHGDGLAFLLGFFFSTSDPFHTGNRKNIDINLFIYLGGAQVSGCTCGDQRIMCGSQFSSSIVCVPGY